MSLSIMLDIGNKKVMVAGGGKIGTRKALSLLESGAIVTCISPDFTSELIAKKQEMTLVERAFEDSDIDDSFLVVAATNNTDVNRRIYELCSHKKVLCQTVDSRNKSDFDFMANQKWDELLIAVSTYGKAPNYSRQLIAKLAETVSDDELKLLHEEILQREKRSNRR